MSKHVVVRYPQMGDLEEFFKFVNALSREDTFVMLSGERVSRQEEKKYLEKVISDSKKKEKLDLALFVDGKLAGNAQVSRGVKRKAHTGRLSIAVLAAYRGRGFGKMLMAETIVRAKSVLGVNLLELTVFANNRVAIKLYEKFGFRKVGVIPKAYQYKGKYCDELIMYLAV